MIKIINFISDIVNNPKDIRHRLKDTWLWTYDIESGIKHGPKVHEMQNKMKQDTG